MTVSRVALLALASLMLLHTFLTAEYAAFKWVGALFVAPLIAMFGIHMVRTKLDERKCEQEGHNWMERGELKGSSTPHYRKCVRCDEKKRVEENWEEDRPLP